MFVKSILSAVLGDIKHKGCFILKNYAGLPVHMFYDAVKTEMAKLDFLEISDMKQDVVNPYDCEICIVQKAPAPVYIKNI